MGPEGGAKKVCVCACVSVYYIQIHTHTQTHTYVYTHIHTEGLVHLVVGTTLGRGRSIPCPPSSWITTEGLLVLWGSFFHKTGGEKPSANGSGFWRPWLVQRRAAKGLGILGLHFWAGMPNLCVSPSSGWKPVCGAGALGSLRSQ